MFLILSFVLFEDFSYISNRKVLTLNLWVSFKKLFFCIPTQFHALEVDLKDEEVCDFSLDPSLHPLLQQVPDIVNF